MVGKHFGAWALALGLMGGVTVLGGCATTTATEEELNEDQPRCYLKARAIEDQAFKEVKIGSKTRDEAKRTEYFERAMNLLREARMLHERELLKDPGPPEREANLQREMDRLSVEIKRLHEMKPRGG